MNEKYKDSLQDKRFPDETFEDYKERRRYNKKRIEMYLQGRFKHKSKHILESKGLTYKKENNE